MKKAVAIIGAVAAFGTSVVLLSDKSKSGRIVRCQTRLPDGRIIDFGAVDELECFQAAAKVNGESRRDPGPSTR